MATSVSNPETAGGSADSDFPVGRRRWRSSAIDATLIQEVVMVGELTPVRHAPDYVAGIRNLRGRIITVIDLCVRLGLGSVEIGPESRILIADWKGEPVGSAGGPGRGCHRAGGGRSGACASESAWGADAEAAGSVSQRRASGGAARSWPPCSAADDRAGKPLANEEKRG